ncbi:MAG: hypothetical protein IT228_04400 [Flavobacteriales bacterium]|nr:hypothetical protein [Flavobacteriales bacterium]MCC6576564.1 hypothetical protein [Flavobacteriales bacterium]NUQ15664.1 hypothetical protein [Flavobacteriales bacterium]
MAEVFIAREEQAGPAIVRCTAQDRMEVYFKPDLTLTVAGIRHMLEVRQRIGAAMGPHKVLVLLPDLVDFEMGMIGTDHYAQVPQPNTKAVAWVVSSGHNAALMQVYMAYYPAPFPSQVFLSEREARAWLGW